MLYSFGRMLFDEPLSCRKIGIRKLFRAVFSQPCNPVWVVTGLFPNLLAVYPIAKIIRALWMMLFHPGNETRMGLQHLFVLPNGWAIRLAAVWSADADIDADSLFSARH
jgi:hypothetical protein